LSGWGGRQVIFTCRGTIDALVATGYLTHFMISARRKRKRGSGHKQLDENGGRFWMHPSPSKTSPERMMLVRRVKVEQAIQLPGMRALFPEGIPEPAQESQNGDRAAHSEAIARDLARTARVALSALEHMEWQAEQLFPIETQARIGAHIRAIRAEFDRRPSARQRGHLRLVVDNDST
jgi:hypothetical protein